MLMAAAILSGACAHTTKQMTMLPPASNAAAANATGTVVLFRVAADYQGQFVPAPLSTRPVGKRYFMVNVADTQKPIDVGDAFPAGQLDSTHIEAGWGFVTLTPGTYRFALVARRTSFTMPGSTSTRLGSGQSGPTRIEVPSDVKLVYIGTFGLTCNAVDRWAAYVEQTCAGLEIRDDKELANQVASAALSRFGPMRTVLAVSTPSEGRR